MANNKKYVKFSELPVKESVQDSDLLVMSTPDNNLLRVKSIKDSVIEDADGKYVNQKTKINGHPLTGDVTLDVSPSGHRHANATLTEDGFLSAEDKKYITKLPLEFEDKATKEDIKALSDKIENLGDGFSSFGEDVDDISDLDDISNPSTGLGVKVKNDLDQYGNSYIWRYNGTSWDRTPFTSTHGKTITKEDLLPKTDKFTFFNISQENNKYDYISAATARASVPKAYRKSGVVIAYSIMSEGWFVEQFQASDSAFWAEEDSWSPIGGGGGLINLTQTNGHSYANSELAREDVSLKDRIPGQLITYLLSSGGWVVDMFIGATSSMWGNDTEWVRLVTSKDLGPLEFSVSELEQKIKIIREELDVKVDGAYVEKDDADQHVLYLTSNGEIVAEAILPAGGGGGGTSDVTMKLRSVGSTTIVVSETDPAKISYSWSSVYNDTQEETGFGSLQISVNNVSVVNRQIAQGTFTEDVTRYLNLGTNMVRVRITDSVNNVRVLNYSVQKASFYLESSFATDTVYFTTPVQFRYTPYGAGDKTIYFWLNDVELPSETTASSGKQMVKMLENLRPGVNTLIVKAETDINGFLLQSNELYIQIAYVDDTITSPLITSSFNTKEVDQHTKITIPYFVYDPNNEVASVNLLVDGTIVSTVQAPRKTLYWDYIATNVGEITLSISCGSTIKNFTLDVIKSDVDITEELANLEFKVSAVGKTNSDGTKDKWEYNGYTTTFQDMFWIEDGWQKDADGNNALRIINDAKAILNVKPFTSTVASDGLTLTLEYSTENVIDSSARVISCWHNNVGFYITPDSVHLRSAQSEISAVLDSSKRTSISFVVEKRIDNQLISLYIDGIISGTINYANTDSFLQAIQQPITVSTGGRNCNVNFYGMRWYKNNLNYSQVLGNFIYDMESLSDKMKVHAENQILDAYGNIDYDKALNYLPIMTIIGDLPQYKGQKKPNTTIIYEDRQNPSYSFTASGVENDVQGTSSQYYPRRNYKFKFKKGLTLTESQEVLSKYPLRGGVPAVEFCVKADFAESSGTHNTGMAVIVDRIMKEQNLLTPPQKENPLVRTTVDGYPILILHKADDQAEATFLGKYNFNNDKASEDVFGFTPGCESWEFRNNFTDICLFKDADWDSTYIDKNGVEQPTWTQDLEGRYPDDNRDISNVRRLYDWIFSCKGNAAKFKAEAKNWFKIDELLLYWVITETFGMIDQRAKNQFLTTYGERGATGELLWQFIFYDNDTCLGINNEGSMEFNYNIETEDVQGSGHIWNGWDSELWILVKEAFFSEMGQLYSKLRTSGSLSVDKVLRVLEDEQAEKWAEQVYNQDGYFKYLGPLIDGFWDYTESQDNPKFIKTAEYLYALQGSRSKHRRFWVTNRLRYMDSRFRAGSYNSDRVFFRVYTPAAGSWVGVPPSTDISITAGKYGYVGVSYGSDSLVTPLQKVAPGLNYNFTAGSGISLNDTETAVHGVSAIRSFGDLAAQYIGTANFAAAGNLRELSLGSTITGYTNTNLTSLDLQSNVMLEVLNVAGCVELKGTLDLSKCTQITNVNASRTKVTSIDLPKSGTLKTMVLPASITNITLRNQPDFEELTLEGTSDVLSLFVENVANVDGYSILKSITADPNNKLMAFRLEGINIRENNASFLYQMASKYGLDDNGNILPSPSSATVSGDAYFENITREAYNLFTRQYPKLNVTWRTMIENTIEFQDPIVEQICLTRWDENNDGFLSPGEVRTEVFPQNILGGTGAEYFNELRYWSTPPSGQTHIINICDTLKEVTFIPGTATFASLPQLTKLTLYPPVVDTPDRAPFNATHITGCPNLTHIDISGRYSTNVDGSILTYNTTDALGDYTILSLVLPKAYDIVWEPEYPAKVILDGFTNHTRSWDIKNLYTLLMKGAPRIDTIRIRSLNKNFPADIELDSGDTINDLKTFIIDSEVGDKELQRLFMRTYRSNGFNNATLMITNSVKCNFTAGSSLQFGKASSGGTTINTVDLGENYKPLTIVFSTAVSNVIPKFIIRSKQVLSRTGTFSGTVYVPDELVETYKQTEWKTNTILGLSQL